MEKNKFFFNVMQLQIVLNRSIGANYVQRADFGQGINRLFHSCSQETKINYIASSMF